MWFFMITCYVMSVLTFFMLLTAFVQSFIPFSVFKANHLTFIILTSIVYLFTETLVIFFFVGTGVSVRDYVQAHKLSSDYHKRSLAVKFKVYPPLLLNMLLMIILFIMVGAVDTGFVARWVYQALFVVCLAHFVHAKRIQNDCFRDNTNNILAMAGVSRGA